VFDDAAYRLLANRLEEAGVDVAAVEAKLAQLAVETPSWGYRDSGTRFGVFRQPGAALTPWHAIADAAEVHRLTGTCPSVALHIPWDQVDDFGELKRFANDHRITIGAINPNLFQDQEYRLGSLCHPEPSVRQRAVQHLRECVTIAREVGSTTISLWLADGTNYPGQDSFTGRWRRLREALGELYQELPTGQRLLIEYKYYEPAFYQTDLPDWGAALLLCQHLGERAQVLVDFGHHALGVNVEQIVALLREHGRLGGFHFNNRKYGDDDLLVGAINPFELFLVFVELANPAANGTLGEIALMLDQSHNVEPKIEAMILSVLNVQSAYARTLLVDFRALEERQAAGDVLGAHGLLQAAYETDVRPLCAKVRQEIGAAADPLADYKTSGYFERVSDERARPMPAQAGLGTGP
jgi:L-rhamnose isomerase/sugar isomerase